MINLRILLAFSALVLSFDILACTTFFVSSHEGDNVVAKGHDWGRGGFLMSNPRNVIKKAMKMDRASELAVWTAKYGSLTYTMFGKDLPVSGMNEAGLTVQMFVLRGSQYPRDPTKPSLNEFQWIQYILDTSATIEDAIANANNVIIEKVSTAVHYMVCSATGRCAIFEYIKGRTKVYQEETSEFFIPVLSNSAYEASIGKLRQYQGFGGNLSIPEANTSLDRFVKAAHFSKMYDSNSNVGVVNYAFDRLAKLSWDHTSWQFVFQPSRSYTWFRRPADQNYSLVDLNEFDFSCAGPSFVLDIGKMEELRSDGRWRFSEYSKALNHEILTRGMEFVDWRMTREEFQHIVEHPSHNRCAPSH